MEKTHQSGVTKTTRLLLFGYWLPVALWMTTIFILSSQHSVKISPDYWLNFIFFKTLHVIEYATLYTLAYRAIAANYPTRRGAWGILAFCIALLYAVTDEAHQIFTPTREPTVRDVIIDGIGAGFIWYYLSIKIRKAPKKLKDWASRLDIPY